MGTSEFNAGCSSAMDLHPIQGKVEVFLVASCHRNWDKRQPDANLMGPWFVCRLHLYIQYSDR